MRKSITVAFFPFQRRSCFSLTSVLRSHGHRGLGFVSPGLLALFVQLHAVSQTCVTPAFTEVKPVRPGRLSLAFQSQSGFSHSVEYKNGLSDPAWTTLINLTAGASGTTTVEDSPPAATRFYRVACYGPVPGGEVHSSVYANVLTPQGSRKIFLPDIAVYLQNTANQVESIRVLSDLNGWFPIPPQPSGLFELRWEAPGFGTGSGPQLVTIAGLTAFPEPIEIPMFTNVISGRVTFQSGEPTYFEQPFFGLAVKTTVRLVDTSGTTVAGPVHANNSGEYVLPAIPFGGYRVVAETETTQVSQSVNTGPAQTIDLVLPNRKPLIKAVHASRAGRGVRSAAPGTTLSVTVEASDPDGDALHFLWRPTGSDGTFTSSDAATVDWTLPSSGGTHTMFVVATDRRGGYAVGSVSVAGNGESVLFTGQVVDENDVPVPTSTVVVNGQATQPNSSGAFALDLNYETNRYVLTITATGFELYSKVLPSGSVGVKYRLHRAQQFVVDPTSPIQVTTTPADTNHFGTQLYVDAFSLVDSNGNFATGPLNLFISTLDMSDPAGRLPGNFGAVNAGGQEVRLASFGAVDIRFQDSGGDRYNLVPGATATLRLPVDPPALVAAAPAQVPVWFYDEAAGLWREEGFAALNGAFYEASLQHFSVLNMDAEFANAACMRLIVPSDSPLKLPFHLRVTVPGVGYYGHPDIVSDALSVITHLPPNQDVTLEPLDSNGNPIPTAKKVVNSGNATGGGPLDPPYPYDNCSSTAILTFSLPSTSGFLDFVGTSDVDEADFYYHHIDPNETAGVGTVRTSSDPKTVTVVGDGTSFDTFFTPGHLIKVTVGKVDHYRTVAAVISDRILQVSDPFPEIPLGSSYSKVGDKPTLTAWRIANGFDPSNDSLDDANVTYSNDADLGFGRWMHMKAKPNGDIAYYVSNYGSADLAFEAKDKNEPTLFLIATVAMEYSPLPGGSDRFTKFYVFDKDGKRVNNAILDSTGPKFIPKLCITCHGGDPKSSPKFGSKFLPFDLNSVSFSPLDLQSDHQAAFKTLNARILDMGPNLGHDPKDYKPTGLSLGVEQLIQGWYNGGHDRPPGDHNLPGNTQTTTFVPQGWTTPLDKSSLYNQVVKPSCRTCHTTRDPGLDFAQYGVLNITWSSRIQSRVCSDRRMPNAEVTFKRFWLSTTPNQPSVLSNAGLQFWDTTKPCPGP
jgi:hypothetical protein